jgi:hypothetical protein
MITIHFLIAYTHFRSNKVSVDRTRGGGVPIIMSYRVGSCKRR